MSFSEISPLFIGPYNLETSLLICKANQWTGVYMLGTSVMKELNLQQKQILMTMQRRIQNPITHRRLSVLQK